MTGGGGGGRVGHGQGRVRVFVRATPPAPHSPRPTSACISPLSPLTSVKASALRPSGGPALAGCGAEATRSGFRRDRAGRESGLRTRSGLESSVRQGAERVCGTGSCQPLDLRGSATGPRRSPRPGVTEVKAPKPAGHSGAATEAMTAAAAGPGAGPAAGLGQIAGGRAAESVLQINEPSCQLLNSASDE